MRDAFGWGLQVAGVAGAVLAFVMWVHGRGDLLYTLMCILALQVGGLFRDIKPKGAK